MADSSSMASELTCSVCLEIYTDPLMLSCMHSYCRKCLQDTRTKTETETDSEIEDELDGAVGGTDKLKCPSCRKRTVLGQDGVDGLPRNFTLANISNKLKATLNGTKKPVVVLCSLCESDPKPAVKTCEDCSGIHYCDDCVQTCHPMRGVFKKHTLIDTLRGNDTTIDKVKTSMYCHTCETSFSLSSSKDSRKHDQHDVDTLDKAVENEKTYVQNALKELNKLNEKQKEKRAKAEDQYNDRKERLREVSQVLQHATRKVDDSLKDVIASYHDYQDNSRQFITEIDVHIQKASLLGIPGEREKEKVSFLKFARQMRLQVTKLRDSNSTKVLSLSSFHQFLNKLSGYVSKELGLFLRSVSLDNSENLVAMTTPITVWITDIKKLPSSFDNAVVEMAWSSFPEGAHHTVTCVLSWESDGCSVQEEIHVNVPPGIKSYLIRGLRHNTIYTAKLTAILDQEEMTAVQTFETARKIECELFWWDTERCSPDMAYSGNFYVVTHKKHARTMIKGQYSTNFGNWIHVNGCSSSIFINGSNIYWETLFRYKVLKYFSGSFVIVSLGICEEKKVDTFASLSENSNSLCLNLYKIPSQSKFGLEFWNGKTGSTEQGSQTFDIEMRKEKLLRLGYFLDFDTRTFKVIMVDENAVIHTFSNINNVPVTVTCEILNEDKVQSSVELQTTGFTTLPSVLFD